MWSMTLEWKTDSSGASASIDMVAAETYFKANAGTEYTGSQAHSVLELWFDAEPSQSEKDACTNYWNDLGKDINNTVTGTTTSMTLSSDSFFTLKVGDKITTAGETRTVDAITDQSTFAIDSAFTSDPTSAGCTIESADVATYVTQAAIESEIATLKSGIVAKEWVDMSTAERKILLGDTPTTSELGLT